MKGHTGGCVTLGRGALMSKSGKQKLNTKSSTETEVVGCSDYVPNPIWGKNFLSHQGYTIQSKLHQDNQSAMKMARNGTKSCGQKSRHIDIRYFWLQDRISKKELDLVYCPTELMVADFFTKPLQGSLFRKLKAVIMGQVDIQTFMSDNSVCSKERVGSCISENHGEPNIVTDVKVTNGLEPHRRKKIEESKKGVRLERLNGGHEKKVMWDDREPTILAPHENETRGKSSQRSYAEVVKKICNR